MYTFNVIKGIPSYGSTLNSSIVQYFKNANTVLASLDTGKTFYLQTGLNIKFEINYLLWDLPFVLVRYIL